MNENFKIVGFSLNKKVIEKLEFLSRELCLKKSTLITTLINEKYNKVKQELYKNKLADKTLIKETLKKNALESDLLMGNNYNDNLSTKEQNLS